MYQYQRVAKSGIISLLAGLLQLFNYHSLLLSTCTCKKLQLEPP